MSVDQAIASKALLFAERYARLGWPVLPVMPGGKEPLNGQGINHATTDLNIIAAWFTSHPDANIGIRLDQAGMLAVDIDPGHGGPLELVDELPATLTANSGGGGRHLLYRLPEGAQPPGKLREGVDLKHHGYIVVEPSVHPSGGVYNWLDWDVLEDGPPDIADAPPVLFTCLGGNQAVRSDRVYEGGRNEFLSREAFKLRKAKLSLDAIEAALLVMNREKCSPELSNREVRAIAAGKARVEPNGASLEDFYAHMPSHSYLFAPTRELWPAASVNGRIPVLLIDGKSVSPSAYLDKHRPIEQLVWYPGEPELIRNRVMQVSGWASHSGARVFNLYRAPVVQRGDPALAAPWIDHVRKVYPEDADHIIKWLAHRAQNPGEKCNHALVLGGMQGIGKDTLLEPVKAAVGPWNWSDINPSQMLGRFNGWVKAVIVRVNEARDLGDVDRFAFYDHSKNYIAAPPDVLRVDEKHLRETYVANVCGVIITTNHATDGLYLPADDRRHYVAWSPRALGEFEADYWTRLYRWMAQGGTGHVAAYLREVDLTGFDAKAPPPKTAAFWNIVAAGEAPESGELRDVLEELGNPEAVALAQLIDKADTLRLTGLADDLRDRKKRPTMPHKMERVGYVSVRNPDAEDGLFRIGKRRGVVYVRRNLPVSAQIVAARRLT
jgi:hypothetical protein